MTPHDLMSMYSIKAIEYLIAISFMLLFIPFWRFVNREKVLAPAVVAAAREWVGELVDWFRVPERVYYHPGHAWLRVDGGDVVTVGMDDFAHKLVGRQARVELPALGSRVEQGEKGWSLAAGGKSVDMLSPVDGTVIEVNARGAGNGEASDPYGDGWLMRVRTPRLAANTKHLLSGTLARKWMEEVCDKLRARMEPELGLVYQDGGLPVDGMAHSLDAAHWDELAREFLLT